MQEPFVAEIRLFSFGFVPEGWVPCDGRLLDITPNQPLFSILGWRQGGDHTSTFAVPAIAWERHPLTFGIAADGLYPRGSEALMDDAYIGEIRLLAGHFAPPGWAPCDGRELPIQTNRELFDLIGHSFGGADQTFAVPDLRDRQPGSGLGFIIALSGTPPLLAP